MFREKGAPMAQPLRKNATGTTEYLRFGYNQIPVQPRRGWLELLFRRAIQNRTESNRDDWECCWIGNEA